MPVDERINKRIEEYGEFAGEGFLAQDGFCFKLSGEETISGEDPVRISFFTTFMPLSEMSAVQREAIFEECMKDIDNLDRWWFFPVYSWKRETQRYKLQITVSKWDGR